jgi:hypothetical protein
MIDKIDSATAVPGTTFRFKITITARIDDILVPENTIGYGVVREVTSAGGHDRNGSLVLEMRELVYGKRIIQVMADPLPRSPKPRLAIFRCLASCAPPSTTCATERTLSSALA